MRARAPCSISPAACSPLDTIPPPSSSPSLHTPQDMQWVSPGAPKPCMDPRAPMCPSGPSPRSISPMLSPTAPVGISAQPGAPRATCAPQKRTHQEPILAPHTSSEEGAQPPRREVETGFNRNIEETEMGGPPIPGRAQDHVYRLPHHIHVSSLLAEVQIPFPWIPESHLLPNAAALRRNSLVLLHREEGAEMVRA